MSHKVFDFQLSFPLNTVNFGSSLPTNVSSVIVYTWKTNIVVAMLKLAST